MANFPGWLQGSYLAASLNASLQRSRNIYPEVIEIGTEKVVGFFRGCPGISLLHTLPTSPVRGLLAAGSPLYSGSRIFCVAGSKLYELNASGVPINGLGGNPDRGDVGNDGNPVQMFPNGSQLGIVSAGQFYCDNGAGPVQATPTAITGGVDTTSGSPAVVWHSGSTFDKIAAGDSIVINATHYIVQSVTDSTHLTLTTNAVGTFTNTSYSVSALNGVVNVNGAAVTWRSGDTFQLYGMTSILLNGFAYTVSSVQSPTSLTLSSSFGNGANIAFGCNPVMAAGSGAFLDSFFIVSPPDSAQLNASAPLDGTSWDSADAATKEGYPDHIGTLLADHEELYVFGESRSEVWRAPGVDANFPFQRDSSLSIHLGIAAPYTAVSAMQGVAWIGGDDRGQPVAYFAQGSQPTRISTHAIEQAWAGFSTVADAVGFVYELDGHIFWQIGFPTGDQTWVYDFTASQQMGKPMWHERDSYDGAAFHRHRASCHGYAFGKHFVGDFANGNIYQLSSSIYQDNGQTITCQRVLPHLCKERIRQFFSRLQLDLETGGGVALTILVDWSDDGGHTWTGGGSAFTVTTSTSKTLDRAVFWRMGSAEDRVFRITVTGNTRIALLMAYLDYLVGTS